MSQVYVMKERVIRKKSASGFSQSGQYAQTEVHTTGGQVKKSRECWLANIPEPDAQFVIISNGIDSFLPIGDARACDYCLLTVPDTEFSAYQFRLLRV